MAWATTSTTPARAGRPRRRPPATRESLRACELDRLDARAHLLEQSLVARVRDLPGAVDLDVAIGVVRRAAQVDVVLDHDHGVLERPAAGRFGVAEQVDDRLVHLVHRDHRRTERLTEELQD